MNKLKTQYLPLFTLFAGITGFLLRVLVNRAGVDEKGLLISGHPAGILLYILSALVLAVLFLNCRNLNNSSRYSKLFPASGMGLAGCVLAAGGILVSGIMGLLEKGDTFSRVLCLFALLSAAGLVMVGLSRFKGKQPHYLYHTCLTVYLMMQLVSEYRYWSPEPQLLLYFFPLLAMVFLMLTAYQATCLDAGKGSRSWYAFCNQAAVFFCFISLLGDHWLFYLSMGLWAGTNLCDLQSFKNRSTENKEA